MLLVIVCLAALFASPQRAWADGFIVSVTIGDNITSYGIVDEAMQVANAATSDVTVTLLADVELVVNPDPQYLQYGYIRFTNTNPVTVGSETRPVMTTLDLNGHTFSSCRDGSDCVIMVGNGSNVNHPSVTITDSKGVGKVENTASGYAIRNFGELHTNNIVINASKGIYNFNNAEAFIRGGNITTDSYCIENMGTIEVSGTKLTSSNNVAIKNNGIATIGEGVSFENCGQNGIWNYSGTLKMTALPTFTNSGLADIRLEKGRVIDFGTGLTAPTNSVSVNVVEYKDGMPVAAALPYAFTKGYKTAFIDSETGTTVDPTDVFTIDGANVVLAGGEAVAYDTNKPLVAVNTASDGSITGLYAKDGTDAEALTAAVTAANAATGDVTVSLLGDVDLGETFVTFNNTHKVGSGDDERTVKITLDLNGHKVTGTSDIRVVEIATGTDVTIVSSAEGGKITDGTDYSHGIDNDGTLTVSGIDILGSEIGIYNSGTLTVTDCNVRGRYDSGICNFGQLTVSGDRFYGSDYGIYSGKDVTFTVWPTFSENVNDIHLYDNAKIVFADDFQAPNTVTQISIEINGDLPYVFTEGYAAAFTSGTPATTVDPAEVFTWAGNEGYGITLANAQTDGTDFGDALESSEAYVATAAVTVGDNVYAAASLAHAVSAANKAESDATVTLLADVDLGATYVTFNNTNTVGSGDDERTVKITLDLNGKTITGSSYIDGYVVEIAAGADVTIIDGANSTPASIINTGSTTSVISNKGTLAVTGIGISETYIGINNYQSGVVVVTNCNISGGNNGIANSGELTIGASVTIKDFTTCGISNSGNLTLNAVPTFTGATNAQWDIMLADFEVSPYQPITLGTGLTKPTSPIRVKVMDYDDNNNAYVLAALPFVFTKGYAAAFTSGDPAKTVDPADVFTISGANIMLIGGEAVAYDTTKPLVAYNTASDGSLTGLYAQDGAYINTDAAAMEAAVNALADGSTLTLFKDVDLGGNWLEILKGTDVTLDLNSKTITGEDAFVFTVGDDNSIPTVTIKNGTIINSNETTGLAILNYGNLKISGANITGYSAIINADTGTLTISNGTITANGSNGTGLDNVGTLTMSDGSVTGNTGIRSLGKLTVSGGTVEGKGGYAIHNDGNAKSCTIGAATIKSDNNYGIWTGGDVTLTAWPTFNGNSIDIALSNNAKIVFGTGFTVPATFNKITVNTEGTYTITSGYSTYWKDGQDNVIDPASVFTWSGSGNYILVLDGDEVVVGKVTVMTLPAGLSTYYNNIGMRVVDSHADGVKMYAVTAVSDNQVVLKEITRRAIPAKTPVIISNSGTEALACTFEEAATSAREGDFVQMFYNDLGEVDLAEAFKGTATDISAYEPTNGATLYGLNGEAFVKIDGTPNIDAHRCWLEIPATASARTRTLTIVFDGSDTTGIRDVREVNAVRGAKDDTWYSLDGRKLDGKPKAKGLYIVNGKKMIIKK